MQRMNLKISLAIAIFFMAAWHHAAQAHPCGGVQPGWGGYGPGVVYRPMYPGITIPGEGALYPQPQTIIIYEK